jgi:hypothetical protein
MRPRNAPSCPAALPGILARQPCIKITSFFTAEGRHVAFCSFVYAFFYS